MARNTATPGDHDYTVPTNPFIPLSSFVVLHHLLITTFNITQCYFFQISALDRKVIRYRFSATEQSLSIIFHSWDIDEPSNFGDIMWLFGNREHCVEMRLEADYLWNDEHCYESRQ